MKLSFNSLCFVLAVFFCQASGIAAPVEAKVKSVSGQVEWLEPGSQVFKPLAKGAMLPVGSSIKTGKDGEAIIVAVPGAAIRVAPSTLLTLGENDFAKDGDKVTSRQATIDLHAGTVSALIQHNERDVTDFKIKTPQGVAAARGTFYGVTVDENGQVCVAVKEGSVGLKKADDQSK